MTFLVAGSFTFDLGDFDDEWERSTRKDIVIEEKVKVNREAVMVLQAMNDEQLGVLQLNRIDTVQACATRGVHCEENFYRATTGEEFTDDEALEWGMKYNRPFAKKWIKDNQEKLFQELSEEDDPERLLKVSRQLRKAYPFNNDLSKKLHSSAFGNSTYGKFMYGIRRWKMPGPYLVFGVAGEHHAMSAMPDVTRFVDVNSDGRFGFERGRLEDWRQFVDGTVRTIVSDCSYGDGEGLEIPPHFYDIYREMSEEGYNVIYKGDGTLGLECGDYYKYRMHNKEAICKAGEGTYVDITAHILVGNMERAAYLLLPGLNKPMKWESHLTTCDVKRLMRCPRKSFKAPLHGNSIMDNIVKAANRRPGRWKELCYGEAPGPVGEMLDIPDEGPIILLDYFETHGDLERLFSSFFQQFEMEKDAEFGWTALNRL